jgi:transcriptional regulator with XRE-family HTH domain
LKGLKQSTLADFARVSVSTIERAERGEKISEECLNRIGQALGYGPGYLTAPRRIRTQDEAYAVLADTCHGSPLVSGAIKRRTVLVDPRCCALPGTLSQKS